MLRRQNSIEIPWEVWVDIKWYEWYYDISNMWRVRSYWKKGNRWSILMAEPCRLLKPRIKKQWTLDLLTVTLYSESKRKYHYRLSRLVAQAFLGLDYKDKKINVILKNNDPSDCSVSNLKLGTASERVINAIGNWRPRSWKPNGIKGKEWYN